LQAIVDSDSSQTVKFYWKVSSEQSHDYLQFYIDSTLKDQISGEVGWQQKSYAVSSGIHTLKWRYVKDGSGQSGDDCGWVDFVQWTGPSPAQDPANWQEIAYKHDVAGRRVEKKVDGYSTRYVHDGGHVIAEYDGNNNLLRKYIYGPGIDQPVSMIEVADANATYYYHFDALGSVVALSDSAGDTVQTYQYSVYGEVAVEDANHPNPYMFAGVRYDIEIGLYYNRARYYNPFMGRFLQRDPVGCQVAMNLYKYCMNNPLNMVDPLGLYASDACDVCKPCDNNELYNDLIEGTSTGSGRRKTCEEWCHIVHDRSPLTGAWGCFWYCIWEGLGVVSLCEGIVHVAAIDCYRECHESDDLYDRAPGYRYYLRLEGVHAVCHIACINGIWQRTR
jgi:RHS repeat-associated protein